MRFSKGLFSVDELTSQQVQAIFFQAQNFKKHYFTNARFLSSKDSDKIVAFVFFEPSTRTRFSFEMACQRMGYKVVTFIGDTSTSMSKGESLRETIHTLGAMKPDLFVIRSGEDNSIRDFYNNSETPSINAGYGKSHHPTQALLDAFTIFEHFGSVGGKKILLNGDIEHSRVAASNLNLLRMLGAEVATTGPEEFRAGGELWEDVQNFNDFEAALKWCDVVMALRTQKERHINKVDSAKLLEPYQLNADSVRLLDNKAMIMHPGPFNIGEEITEDVLNDPRCFIYKQIENGVYIRAALLGFYLGDLG